MTIRTATGRTFSCANAFIPAQGNAHLILETSMVMAALIFASAEETASITLVGEQNEEQTLTGYTHVDVISNEQPGFVRVSIRPPRPGEDEEESEA